MPITDKIKHSIATLAGMVTEDSTSGDPEIVKSTNQANHVRMIANDVTDPSEKYLEFTGTAGAADNAVIYTSPDVSAYNYHTIAVTGTNAADVEVSLDGTNWIGPVAVRLHDDVTTGGGIDVVSIPTGDFGILKGKFKNIRVLQNGATDANAYGAHGVI